MSETLKFGDGNWATKEGSTLAYNDENGNFKPLPFNFERSTGATRVNKQGLIEVVTNNKPRIDYKDDANGALLLEPERTNLVTYSEDFSNAAWTKSGTSVVSGFVSPKGDLSAFKLVEDTSTAVHTINTITSAVGSNYSLSIFAKAGERRYISLAFSDLAEWLSQYTFDLTDGVLTDTYNFTGVTSIFKSEVLADGWYKLSLSSNYTFVTNVYSRIFIEETATPPTIPTNSYTGDGTSGVYIFGAQLEQGSYATSYIPTQGSIGTRVAEVCIGAGNNQVINSTEGTLFIEFTHVNTPLYKSIALMNVAETSVIRIYTYFNVLYFERLKTGEPTISIPVDISAFENLTIKAAFRWALNDFKGCFNGTLTTGATGVVFGANDLAKLDFRSAAGSIPFYGDLKQTQVYNTALLDAELQTLTNL